MPRFNAVLLHDSLPAVDITARVEDHRPTYFSYFSFEFLNSLGITFTDGENNNGPNNKKAKLCSVDLGVCLSKPFVTDRTIISLFDVESHMSVNMATRVSLG